MNMAFFGFWDIPVSEYWVFYLAFGVAGGVLCNLHRKLSFIVFPVLAFFVVRDLWTFQSAYIGPGTGYIVEFVIGVGACLLLCVLGLIVRPVFLRKSSSNLR